MPNELMREQWTDHGGPAWTRNQHIFAAVYAPVTARLLSDLGDVTGQHVLDIGCGTGDVSQAIADRGGTATGVDISATMIDGARALHPGIRFEVADAQVDDLGTLGPFHLATSRFGVMFFDDPVAAFANIRAAMRPSGRLVFACWRTLGENPVFTLGTHLLAERLPELPPGPGAPGPTAFADAGVVTAMLGDAGWRDATVSPFDATLRFAFHGSDGVEERIAVILGGATGRRAEPELRPALGEHRWAALLDDVRAEVRTSIVDGAVQFPGAMWIVTASNPGSGRCPEDTS